MRLLPQHQRLLLCAGGVALGFLLFAVLAVRPLAVSVRDQKQRVEELRRQLREAGIQADLARLRLRLAQATEDHDRLATTTELVTARARGMFDERIRTQYGSLADFRTQVSRLDYQEEYTRIQQELGRRGVRLSEDVLNLSENTVSPATWQLVLQLWTVESLVHVALESRLNLVTVEVPRKADLERGAAPATETAAGPAPDAAAVTRVARITVLPVREYVLPQDAAPPYLLEIPVRITVTGRLQDLCFFLKAVVEPPNRSPRGGHAATFLPVSRFEIRKPVPATAEDENQVEAILECCGFFPLVERGGGALPAATPPAEPGNSNTQSR